jgi:hypothetical protein
MDASRDAASTPIGDLSAFVECVASALADRSLHLGAVHDAEGSEKRWTVADC